MAWPTVVLLLVPWSNRCPIDWMDKLYTSAQYKPLLHLSSSSRATNNCKSSPRGQSQEIRQYLEGANQSEESIVSFFLDDHATSFESWPRIKTPDYCASLYASPYHIIRPTDEPPPHSNESLLLLPVIGWMRYANQIHFFITETIMSLPLFEWSRSIMRLYWAGHKLPSDRLTGWLADWLWMDR